MKTICDWNNCFEIGEYRAPIEKITVKILGFFMFETCKEFNKNWNYFSGMSDKVINFLKNDATWHKPTQTLALLIIFLKYYGTTH